MTPQEKAKDLYDSYWYCLLQSNIVKRDYWSRQCAIIAVDEILDELLEIVTVTSSKYIIKHINYYQEVKHEIEKL
jgi:hypothetical protein